MTDDKTEQMVICLNCAAVFYVSWNVDRDESLLCPECGFDMNRERYEIVIVASARAFLNAHYGISDLCRNPHGIQASAFEWHPALSSIAALVISGIVQGASWEIIRAALAKIRGRMAQSRCTRPVDVLLSSDTAMTQFIDQLRGYADRLEGLRKSKTPRPNINAKKAVRLTSEEIRALLRQVGEDDSALNAAIAQLSESGEKGLFTREDIEKDFALNVALRDIAEEPLNIDDFLGLWKGVRPQ